MKAAVWYGKQDVRVEEREERSVQPGQVKIKVEYAGICGSDLHAYHHGVGIQEGQEHPLSGQKAPLVLGHEFSGVVAEIGPDVTGIEKGQRVAVEPLYHCGVCEYCLQGHYNQCVDFGFVGLNGDGGFADYVVVEAYMVHALPDNVSFEEGALVEPTAVAMHAVRHSSLKVGQKVAVYGAGPIGLLTVLCAKAAGASQVYAVDVFDERLKLAEKLGAIPVNSSEVDAAQAIQEQSGGIDIAFEAAGVQPTMDSAVSVVKKGGQVVVIAAIPEPLKVDFFQMLVKEATVTATLAYRHIFPEIIALIEAGALDVKSVITHKIGLDDIVDEGLELLIRDKSHAKILVKIGG
ncbi:butanediol dehydrogenase [Saccharibacillus sp. O23]|uniref:2,3-butanediol dehydrogenase n=1 Tax=Saccharibacillus sp. O23 TaxID=2009338 RepID=UPI000B4E7640|nr:2,3-butanediol dehydrogenase [Saccharibacillus sp. O23]OWR28906.1 butanediol dehydrogenase [Saccharibacillus sp. O23]